MREQYGNPVFGRVTQEYPVADTEYGKVAGENRNGIAVFRGIPYGGSCDGNNRFLPAREPKAWTGIRDCRKNGPIAVQEGGSITASWDFGNYFSGGNPEPFGCNQEIRGENCLVLNVLTPQPGEGKRPVIVYIHGGGFASGSGTTVLGADGLVREQDIVLVGINHRLNAFGFLYLGEIEKDFLESGTAGMTDLVLALKWVHKNIGFFGGDPENVIVMGESGGGIKIATLLAMPETASLIKGAVMESAFGKPGRYTTDMAADTTAHFLYQLEIKDNVIARLQELPDSHICGAAFSLGPFAFEPAADGIHLPFNAKDGFPMVNPQVPIIVGSSEDELAAFASEQEHKIQTEEEMIHAIVNGCGPGWMRLPETTPSKAQELIRVFRSMDRKGDDNAHLLMKICTMCGPLEQAAFEHAVYCSAQNAGSVFRYLNAYDAPHRVIPEKRFSWHGADLPLQLRIVLHPESEAVSKRLAAFLGAFARTGDPSLPNLNWAPFSAACETMIIDDCCRIECDPTRPYREAMSL